MVELVGDQVKLTAVSAVTAIELLGLSHIVTARQWVAHTGVNLLEISEIPFTEGTLRECALANYQGKADWRLTFCDGKYYLINWAGDFLGMDQQAKSRAVSNLDPKFSACPKDILNQVYKVIKEVRGEKVPWNFYFPVSYHTRVNDLSACHEFGGSPRDHDEEAKKEVVAILRKPDLEI